MFKIPYKIIILCIYLSIQISCNQYNKEIQKQSIEQNAEDDDTTNGNNANHSPKAENASFQEAKGQALNGRVIASDPDGDTLYFEFPAINSSEGSLIGNSDGSFTFTPSADFTGVLTFTYTVKDGTDSAALSDTGSVTMHFIDPSGTIYYVDGNTGDDNNPGTDTQPLQTITKANDLVQPGDTVLIKGGTYSQQMISPKQSGTIQFFDKDGIALDDSGINWTTDKTNSDEGDRVAFWNIFKDGSSKVIAGITYRAFGDAPVIIDGGGASWPISDHPIYGGAINLLGKHAISIDGITIRNVRGWGFIKDSHHFSLLNSSLELAHNWGKGSLRIVRSKYPRIVGNKLDHGCDNLTLSRTRQALVENNNFTQAYHSLLSIYCSWTSVIRNNRFSNSYCSGDDCEKLVEVYDCWATLGNRTKTLYTGFSFDDTKYNLFEKNVFGYHPANVSRNSQPSAIQYSGQNGIIRKNVFSNPPAADASAPRAGGPALNLRVGGSREEGPEARYTDHNRVYNNVFYHYYNGAITVPPAFSADWNTYYHGLNETLNPWDTPLSSVDMNDSSFEDNVFKNNAFYNNIYKRGNSNTADDGKIIHLYGRQNQGVLFENNAYGNDLALQDLIYMNSTLRDVLAWNDSALFDGNQLVDPLFQNPPSTAPIDITKASADVIKNGFRPDPSSPLIDSDAFLTTTSTTGSGTSMHVADAGYFYDGFGILGEQGDTIKLESGQSFIIERIDYANNILTIKNDNQDTWTAGERVSLDYSGNSPDIGAFETGLD